MHDSHCHGSEEAWPEVSPKSTGVLVLSETSSSVFCCEIRAHSALDNSAYASGSRHTRFTPSALLEALTGEKRSEL